jgi:hypothetical protein
MRHLPEHWLRAGYKVCNLSNPLIRWIIPHISTQHGYGVTMKHSAEKAIQQHAEEQGITAGEVNASLLDSERGQLVDGEQPVATSPVNNPENAPAPTVPEAEQAECRKIGSNTAHEIEDARNASDSVAKALLLQRAQEFASRPNHVQFYLDGFAQGLTELHVKDSVVRARKSEAKAVVDAYAKTVTEKLEDARAKLEQCAGTYHEFITLAREIRGKTTNRPTGSKSVKQRLTDNEQERALELIRSMTAGQASDAAKLVAAHLFSMTDGEMAVLRMLDNVFMARLAMSTDSGISKWATDSRSRIYFILDAWEKSRPVTQVAQHTAPAIPEPATEQRLAA